MLVAEDLKAVWKCSVIGGTGRCYLMLIELGNKVSVIQCIGIESCISARGTR